MRSPGKRGIFTNLPSPTVLQTPGAILVLRIAATSGGAVSATTTATSAAVARSSSLSRRAMVGPVGVQRGIRSFIGSLARSSTPGKPLARSRGGLLGGH
jgi:hypothetical protein